MSQDSPVPPQRLHSLWQFSASLPALIASFAGPSSAGGWQLINSPSRLPSSLVDAKKNLNAPLKWSVINEPQPASISQEQPEQGDKNIADDESSSTITNRGTTKSLPIFSIGVGARGLAQDTTNATVQGAVRAIQFGDRVVSSASIRPGVIFPNSDCPSCKYEYRLAGTVDFLQSEVISFYLGGGAAFNKDGAQNGETLGMFTAGIEINLTRNLAITGNLNLINQPSAPEFGGLTWADAETSLLFTARF